MLKLVLVAFILSGCGATPYIELGVGYQFNSISDPWYELIDTGQPWVCQIEPGIEGKYGRLGWQHESRCLDGNPLNDNPELHREMLRYSLKFGE